jgi:hypothetical protein
MGDRRRPAAVAAAARGDGEEGVLLGQCASLGCAIDPRECARGLGLQRERPEEGVLRRRRQWRAARRGWQLGWRAREWATLKRCLRMTTR